MSHHDPTEPLTVIPPQTDGTITLDLSDTRLGTPILGAVVAGDVYRPDGRLIATAAGFTELVSGAYALAIDPLWSDDAGTPIEGRYRTRYTVLHSGEQTRGEVCWVCAFEC